MNIYTHTHPFNSDLYTVIGMYKNLRNKHRKPVLLESNDYHSRAESKSIIGLNPLIEIKVFGAEIEVKTASSKAIHQVNEAKELQQKLVKLIEQNTFQNPNELNGFISYFGFEFAHYAEGIIPTVDSELKLPHAYFILYETYIIIDHFFDTGYILTNSFECLNIEDTYFTKFLNQGRNYQLPFTLQNSEKELASSEEFLSTIEKIKGNLNRGDVFQLVVSRRFKQAFFGDDFQVYRALRRLNPSPYLFYLDFEEFRLIGSSPECQIHLKNDVASIHPIAGTIKKSGDIEKDKLRIAELISDEKENSEHSMLVDLARNDLSKFCTHVSIEKLKEVQHFSHVFHLVSKIIGQTKSGSLDLFSGTFPAGTLSGTPKPKALALIAEYENHPRGFYGGAIGMIGINRSMNLAIIIRSTLSQNNQLYYQAGAGIVLDSIPKNELKEVENKLGAIRLAIEKAANSATETPVKLEL